MNCNGGSSVPRNRKPYGSKNSNGPTELYRSGQNPILAYIETMKPEADPARIKRAETAAKIAAWSNMLTALGTGIVGMATEGYVPKPVPMLRCECSTGSMSGKNYTTAKTANTDN